MQNDKTKKLETNDTSQCIYPHDGKQLVRTAKELAAASLKDEGCVAYDLFESATRSDVLMICETWSNAKALAAHEQASHFTTLVPRLEQLGELKIEKFVF